MTLKILKSSGKYLERQAQRSLILAFLCIAVASVLFLVFAPKLITRIDFGDYAIPFALAMVPLILGSLHYWRRYKTTSMGIEGEKRVAQFLQSKLSDDYYLLNDVLYVNKKGWKENIDHIVLGPNGVFAIETKHYSGNVACKGSYWQVPFPFGRSPSSQAMGNARWVNEAIKASEVFETLNVWVEPIVVFSNPHVKLEIIDPEIEVVTLDKLTDSIILYNKGYNFSSEQLKLMGKGILKQASY